LFDVLIENGDAPQETENSGAEETENSDESQSFLENVASQHGKKIHYIKDTSDSLFESILYKMSLHGHQLLTVPRA